MQLTRTALAFATLATFAPAMGGFGQPAHAPSRKTQAAAAAAPADPTDPVRAREDGEEIHALDFVDLNESLSSHGRPSSQAQLLELAINDKALVIMARKDKLDTEPTVARAMKLAGDARLLSEDKLRALYDATIAGKPGKEEIHVRHMLIESEEQARLLIAQLKSGADFATLAQTIGAAPAAADAAISAGSGQARTCRNFRSWRSR